MAPCHRDMNAKHIKNAVTVFIDNTSFDGIVANQIPLSFILPAIGPVLKRPLVRSAVCPGDRISEA